MSRSDDLTADDRQTIAAALRHLKEEVLFAFGAEGDECIQRLVALEAALPGAQAAIFRAIHQGMDAQARASDDLAPPLWLGPAALAHAYEMGGQTVRLNAQRRRESGLNVGPLDTPKMQLLLMKAKTMLGRVQDRGIESDIIR